MSELLSWFNSNSESQLDHLFGLATKLGITNADLEINLNLLNQVERGQSSLTSGEMIRCIQSSLVFGSRELQEIYHLSDSTLYRLRKKVIATLIHTLPAQYVEDIILDEETLHYIYNLLSVKRSRFPEISHFLSDDKTNSQLFRDFFAKFEIYLDVSPIFRELGIELTDELRNYYNRSVAQFLDPESKKTLAFSKVIRQYMFARLYCDPDLLDSLYSHLIEVEFLQIPHSEALYDKYSRVVRYTKHDDLPEELSPLIVSIRNGEQMISINKSYWGLINYVFNYCLIGTQFDNRLTTSTHALSYTDTEILEQVRNKIRQCFDNTPKELRISRKQLAYLFTFLGDSEEQVSEEFLINLDILNRATNGGGIFRGEQSVYIAKESLHHSDAELAERYHCHINTLYLNRMKIIAILAHTLQLDNHEEIQLTSAENSFINKLRRIKTERFQEEALQFSNFPDINSDIRSFFASYAKYLTVNQAYSAVGITLNEKEVYEYDKYMRNFFKCERKVEIGIVLKRYLFALIVNDPGKVDNIIKAVVNLSANPPKTSDTVYPRANKLINLAQHTSLETEIIRLAAHISMGGKSEDLSDKHYILSAFIFNLHMISNDSSEWENHGLQACGENGQKLLSGLRDSVISEES